MCFDLLSNFLNWIFKKFFETIVENWYVDTGASRVELPNVKVMLHGTIRNDDF